MLVPQLVPIAAAAALSDSPAAAAQRMLINIRYDTHKCIASTLTHMQELQSNHLAGSCMIHRSGSCSLVSAEECVIMTDKHLQRLPL